MPSIQVETNPLIGMPQGANFGLKPAHYRELFMPTHESHWRIRGNESAATAA